jgi:DNA replication and repair protein RecF
MFLNKLTILNFKNYEDANLQFSENINCLLGDNGGGKTNLLDAIYYLSFCKSYFNPIDTQNIKHEAPFFVVEGYYLNNKKEDVIYCGLKRKQKKIFKRNKKAYERFADHIGTIPLVIISPSDILLVIEGSEVRRKFVDGIISQYDNTYLKNLLAYNKALNQRNLLLKSFWLNKNYDADSLEIWNEQLIKYGKLIYESRNKFIEDFTPVFQKYYTLLSQDKETVKLDYNSQLSETDFKILLEENIAKDRANHYSNFGIHKDDLLFKIGEHPLKKFGSQGQQKTYLLALKLAQAALTQNITQKKVTILLDDIYDKLDEKRMSQLIAVVGNKEFGQIFITDTSKTRIPELLSQEKFNFKAFIINEGEVNDV